MLVWWMLYGHTCQLFGTVLMASGYYHAQISRSDESALLGGLTEGSVATVLYTSIPLSLVQDVLWIHYRSGYYTIQGL